MNTSLSERIKWIITGKGFDDRGMVKKSEEETVTRVIYIGGRPWIYTIPSSELVDHNVSKRDINAGICVRVICDKIASLPWILEKRIIKNGDESWDAVNDHPVLDALEYPNEWTDEDELKKHIVQSYLLCGKAHIFILRGGLSYELWPMSSWQMRIVYDANKYPVKYKRTDEKGSIHYFDKEEIIHLKNYDMTDPFEGGNALSGAKDQILSNRYAVEYNKKFFKNGATYSMLFTQDGIVGMDPDQQAEFLDDIDTNHSSIDNSYKSGILPPGVKPFQASPTIKDMTFEVLYKLNREQILGWFGVPPTEAGVLEFATYANALSEKRSFWENRLNPFRRTIERGITRQFLWPIIGNREMRLRLDTSNIGALQDDKEIDYRCATSGYGSGIITLNEARAMVNHPAIDGGDEFKRPEPSIMDYLNSEDDDDDDNSQDDEGDNKNIRNYRHSIILKNNLGAHENKKSSGMPIRDFVKKTQELYLSSREAPYSKILGKYFKEQSTRILTNIKDTLSNSYYRRDLLDAIKCMDEQYEIMEENRLRMKSGNVLLKEIPVLTPSEIFKLAEENEIWEAIGRPYIDGAYKKAGGRIGRLAGIHFSFDVNNPMVTESINRLVNRSKYFNNYSFKKIKDILHDAYDNGLSAEQLRRSIQDQYEHWVNPAGLDQSRAMTIARTEMVAVVNGGADRGMKQAQDLGLIEGKEWVATFDGDTRDPHGQADGEVVSAYGYFEIDGEKLEYPGDPNGSVGNTANCRCSVIPYKKGL